MSILNFRLERDSMGEIAVPKDKFWGAQTQRSLGNFDIGKETMPSLLISALFFIKLCCARANNELLPEKMTNEKLQLIEKAFENRDKLIETEFPLKVWQTGSGTQTNMNVNEVIANYASSLSDTIKLHPNDDINMSQSSNDVFPSYDGNENQNGYSKDMVDYYFESDATLKYYLDSVALSSEASNTYTRYSKNTRGYFNVCDGNGSSTPYNLTYADGKYTLSVAADKYVMSTPKYTNLVDGYCTASILCYVCDCQISEGIKHEYNTTVTYADFTKGGVKTTGCTHDYCALYANPVVVELDAIFSDFKYSVREDQTTFGLVMAYKVNNMALAEYEAINGSLSFGVMAVSKKNITTIDGENEIISNPLNNDGTTSLNNVVVADVSNSKLANVNLIIIGSGEAWDEAKTVDFYVLGYVINGEELQYFQNSSNASVSALTTITYENAKEVA